MSKPTGFYDRRGIPIYVGDLIRVPHFRHYRRREQMWLYFRVAELSGRFVLQCWHNLDATQHQCLLGPVVEGTEVLAHTELERDEDGAIVMWCDRKRKKVQP